MANYRVRRIFPAHHPVKHGQVIEDPQWRNLGLLVRQGYLEEIGLETAAAPAEIVEEKPVEVEVTTPAADVKTPAARKPKTKVRSK